MSQELSHENHAASALHAAILESHPDALKQLSFSQAQQLIQILMTLVPQIIAIFKTPATPTP